MVSNICLLSCLLWEPFVACLRPRIAANPHLVLHLRHRPIYPPRTPRLVGELVVPWMTPSAIIHDIHCRRTRSLNGLLKPTSTGWQREVHPPGRCVTSIPSSWILVTTDCPERFLSSGRKYF